jgi:hypothetical protein
MSNLHKIILSITIEKSRDAILTEEVIKRALTAGIMEQVVSW